MSPKALRSLLTVGAFFISPHLQAHEAGAPYSGAIIDPLALHHAHIENEQRINFFVLRGVAGPLGEKRTAYESELELAWSNAEFDLGAELFIPLLRMPSSTPGENERGIGDIEIRPIKYSFVNRPQFVMSMATAIGLPTGDEDKGLGSGNTTLTQFLFIDKALGNWFAGLNLGADARVAGDNGWGVEYGIALSYSFIEGTARTGLASPLPAQSVVISPSLELVGEKRYDGPDDGERSISLIPGLTAWWPRSGWQLHAGVSLPQSGERESDRAFLLQLGNHLNWKAWLDGSRAAQEH